MCTEEIFCFLVWGGGGGVGFFFFFFGGGGGGLEAISGSAN